MKSNSLTEQELLALLQKFVDEQYDEAIDDYDVEKMEWIPAEAEIKAKLPRINHMGMIDLTHVKSSKIKEEILKCANFRVGKFKITISRYHHPPQNGGEFLVDLSIREEKRKTPSGQDCLIDYRTDLLNDSRFKSKSWLKHFKDGSYAHQMPIDEVVEMARWMQIINKLPAFL